MPSQVQVPDYDRSIITPGIVHLGAGAFHRAHQAIFVDDALNHGATDLGIIAVSLRSPDTRDALEPQDNLYTVAFKNGDKTTFRIVGSLLETLVAPQQPDRVLDWLCDPRIRLVTLTITEKAYAIDPATGKLDRSEPGISADLENPEKPISAFGYLAKAIARRRTSALDPFTLLSCDNLSRNGHVLQAALSEFAATFDPELAEYIRHKVPVCSSMVDRIVPATSEADRQLVASALGVTDAWPVTCEPAFAWIIEGPFPFDRSLFEKSGVIFVEDVLPFEQMKLRLLNGAHTAIAAIGRLASFSTVPEAVADARIAGFLTAYWAEALQSVSIDPAVALTYQQALLPRFANTALPHKTAQIATDASQKVTPRILLPLSELINKGLVPDAMIMAVALWIKSCGGFDDTGKDFEIRDPLLERWVDRSDQMALTADAVVDRFLTFKAVFGPDLPHNPVFVTSLKTMFAELAEHGTLAALEARFTSQSGGA